MQWSNGAWANKASMVNEKKWKRNWERTPGRREERRMHERIFKSLERK